MTTAQPRRTECPCGSGFELAGPRRKPQQHSLCPGAAFAKLARYQGDPKKLIWQCIVFGPLRANSWRAIGRRVLGVYGGAVPLLGIGGYTRIDYSSKNHFGLLLMYCLFCRGLPCFGT